ncbi:MAG: hypothetical protein J7K89_03930, partial [Candidatus Cloacimonetes bacterium]|nr:hypothetical protein [Candidatus Cloacimonadota bacterium]
MRSKSEGFLIFFSEILDPLFVEQASVKIPQRDGIFRLPETFSQRQSTKDDKMTTGSYYSPCLRHGAAHLIARAALRS